VLYIFISNINIPYLGLYNTHWCIMRTDSWKMLLNLFSFVVVNKHSWCYHYRKSTFIQMIVVMCHWRIGYTSILSKSHKCVVKLLFIKKNSPENVQSVLKKSLKWLVMLSLSQKHFHSNDRCTMVQLKDIVTRNVGTL
jgi:hypothetical protein